MSDVTNTEIANAFRAAKKRLATTRNEWRMGQKKEFICHALDRSIPAGNKAAKIVNERLDSCGTVTSWVITNAPGAREMADKEPIKFDDEVQLFRHRWLDSLIEEFSEMTFTTEERKRIALCLRNSIKNLWDGNGDLKEKEKYICFALKGPNADIHLTQEVIKSRLDYSCDTVDGWLERRGYLKMIHGRERDRQVQAYRHRWLDALIEEFSN